MSIDVISNLVFILIYIPIAVLRRAIRVYFADRERNPRQMETARERRPLVIAVEPQEIDSKHARSFDDPQFVE